MSQRIAQRLVLLLAVAWFGSALCATASQPSKNGQPSVNDLSLEVSALQSLYQFRFTPEQMAKLKKVAARTADDSGARQAAKANDVFRGALVDLRTALVAAKDEERIAKLQEKVEKLRDTEHAEVDDGVELTDEARRQAPEVLRWLSARQVTTYLAAFGDQFPDPLERWLELALGKVRGLQDAQWKQMRDEVSEEVGRLVVGLDLDKAGQVGDQVVQLLIQSRALKDNEFKKERPELEKMARQIVGKLGPMDVLQHAIERTLAELLANPRLAAAIDARLKKKE